MKATRLANRTITDAIVDCLIDSETQYVWVEEILAELAVRNLTRTPSTVLQELRYLAHCYGAVKLSPLGSHWCEPVQAGLTAYVEGSQNRTACHCGTCGGAGEYER